METTMKKKMSLDDIDNRVYGMMIAKFAWSDFFKGLSYVDSKTGEKKFCTDESIFETVISLLEDGYLYIADIGDQKLTIMPCVDDEPKRNDVTDKVDLEALKGRYEEFAKLQRMCDRMVEYE